MKIFLVGLVLLLYSVSISMIWYHKGYVTKYRAVEGCDED